MSVKSFIYSLHTLYNVHRLRSFLFSCLFFWSLTIPTHPLIWSVKFYSPSLLWVTLSLWTRFWTSCAASYGTPIDSRLTRFLSLVVHVSETPVFTGLYTFLIVPPVSSYPYQSVPPSTQLSLLHPHSPHLGYPDTTCSTSKPKIRLSHIVYFPWLLRSDHFVSMVHPNFNIPSEVNSSNFLVQKYKCQ